MAYTLPRRDLIKYAAASGLMLATGARLLAQGTQPDVPIELSMAGGRRAFTKHPRAAILSYPIRYIMAGEGNGGGRVGIFLTLRGPTEADMAQLAGEARDDLARRFEAIGFPVMTQADMMANPVVAALDWTQPHWDDGTPDPLGRRIWYNTGVPGAPVLNRWGSTTGSAEYSIISRMAAPSRALDAMIVIPSLFLEFSTVSGSTNRGSQGSTSWTGGELAFGIKPFSWTFCMSGGQRNNEAFGVNFSTRGRGVILPRQLPGTMHTGVAAPSADMTERLGRARIDAFEVDMTAWRDWVRAAFRGYNSELARHFQEGRAG